MLIKTAEYIGSFVETAKCPQLAMPEFAFIGRSNVGKSSLINYLTGRKKLSKVSVTPGKTQTINFFNINNRFHLVDLPGYGYAKISKQQRDSWSKMIRSYILQREQLQYVMQLIDARVPPQKADIEFINWMGENEVPFVLIFTKADKPNARETQLNIRNFGKEMLKYWDALPGYFVTSAEKNSGREQVLLFLENAVQEYYRNQ
ncbi:MAG: ribosome biogenesis GTP-binding protein YihA/YsxC [Chitinophagales bacterium]|nr:ribosome biogenesis GTP-binding protein YihA/YsxC [Chitinophagales bacterium]